MQRKSKHVFYSVMKVKCKSFCVRFYVSSLVFFQIFILKWLQLDSIHFLFAKRTIAHSLLLNAYLSVPHSFEAFNLNSDAISLSQL